MTGKRGMEDLIWDTIRRIPKGKVATYGDIARVCGIPGGARRIGFALRTAPRGLRLPWQRVVNSKGMISLPKADGQYSRQKSLLRHEGIEFRHERIDLKKFRWLKHFSR